MQQMIEITDELRLRPYDYKCEFALEWYQDRNLEHHNNYLKKKALKKCEKQIKGIAIDVNYKIYL